MPYRATVLTGGRTFQYNQLLPLPNSIPSGLIGEDEFVGGGGNVKRLAFGNSDLSAQGTINFNHNIKQYALAAVFDNNDLMVIPTEITAVDADTIRVNLSGITPISGVWHLVVAG